VQNKNFLNYLIRTKEDIQNERNIKSNHKNVKNWQSGENWEKW